MTRNARLPGTSRRLAGWQRLLLFAIWLGLFLRVWHESRIGSIGWIEFASFAFALALSIWCVWHPLGGYTVHIRDASEMRGEFRSQPSWSWILVSASVSLVGLATGVKLARDLQSGAATIADVSVNMVDFFAEWLLDFVTKGHRGDITHVRLDMLVVLLPIGLAMLWYNLLAIIFRGNAFRIEGEASLQVKHHGEWLSFDPGSYSSAVAGGLTIDFQSTSASRAAIVLPQWRVYSCAYRTAVAPWIVANFFRHRLEACGFRIEPGEPKRRQAQWIATRPS